MTKILNDSDLSPTFCFFIIKSQLCDISNDYLDYMIFQLKRERTQRKLKKTIKLFNGHFFIKVYHD